MTGNPADHPAVANPQAATATNKVLAAPVLAAPAVVGQASAQPPNNNLEAMLRDLFPSGVMNNVIIKNMNTNKNPIATAPMSGYQYGAWTQSGTLVYVRDDLFNDYDIFAAFMLMHEAEHIQQFRAPGAGRPPTFEAMLSFEVGAYTKTYNWINSKKGRKALVDLGFDPVLGDQEEYIYAVKVAKATAESVLMLYTITQGQRVGRVIARGVNGTLGEFLGGDIIPANTQQTKVEHFFENMWQNDMIPPPEKAPDANGNLVPQRYTSLDMYLQPTDADFSKRMRQLGFKIAP